MSVSVVLSCHHSVAVWSYARAPHSPTQFKPIIPLKFPAVYSEATNVAQLCCFWGIAQFVSNTHVHAAFHKQCLINYSEESKM